MYFLNARLKAPTLAFVLEPGMAWEIPIIRIRHMHPSGISVPSQLLPRSNSSTKIPSAALLGRQIRGLCSVSVQRRLGGERHERRNSK